MTRICCMKKYIFNKNFLKELELSHLFVCLCLTSPNIIKEKKAEVVNL